MRDVGRMGAGPAITVLFVCVPAAGHVTPLLPLTGEFARHGDRVVVASGPDVEAAVRAAGLEFRQVAASFGEWFAALAARSPGPPGAGLPPEHVERYFIPRLFAEVGVMATRDGLETLVDQIAPDLIVFEPYALAAPLVAARRGIPAVHHMIGLSWDGLTNDLVGDALTPAWTAAGLAVPRVGGLYRGMTLTIVPPMLRDLARDAQFGAELQPLRTTRLADRTLPLPVELDRHGRPLVYVTLGTSFNEPDVFATLLAGLADLPVTVLATIGRNRTVEELGPVPDNATVLQFVPQDEVLPQCAVAVHHGGAGTALGVLTAGVPSVVVPRGADNFTIADRMADAGTARVVAPDRLSPGCVADAVRAVLDDPNARAAASRAAQEIAAMPGPQEVVALLHDRVAAAAR